MDPQPKQEEKAPAAATTAAQKTPVAATTAPQNTPVAATPVLNVPSVRKVKVNEEDEAVTYLCGDCGQENTLEPGSIIQCRECGYRVLYKKRTRRIIEYQAR